MGEESIARVMEGERKAGGKVFMQTEDQGIKLEIKKKIHTQKKK